MTRATTSASNLFRREICQGSDAAEAIFPEEEDSEYSTEGTLLHNLDAKPDPEAEAKLTTEQREVLDCARRMDEDIFSAFRKSLEITEDETYQEVREHEMWFRRGLKALFPGHTDRMRYYPRQKVLIIIDKKFGFKEVQSAEANLQLRAYAVMGAAKYDCDHVMVAINQPRLPWEERLKLASYTREEIVKAKAHILSIWDGAKQPDAPRVADDEACRYCKARLTCDAYRAKYEWMEKPSHDGKDAFVAKLAELDDAALDRVWRAVVFAGLVADSAKKEILRRMASGGMPMYEASEPGKTSTINDPVRAAALLKAFGLSDADILACTKFTKEKLADKIYDTPGISSIAAAKKKLGEILRPVLDITEKSPSLTRIRDWQPAPRVLTDSDADLFPR